MKLYKEVRYSGVCLSKQQRALFIQKIENWMEEKLPDLLAEIKDWRKLADHSTICMGKLPKNIDSMLGSEILLTPTHIGFDEKVIAFKVNGNYLSQNKTPHITYAVNMNKGAQAKDSNALMNWLPLDFEMTLTGIVREIS